MWKKHICKVMVVVLVIILFILLLYPNETICPEGDINLVEYTYHCGRAEDVDFYSDEICDTTSIYHTFLIPVPITVKAIVTNIDISASTTFYVNISFLINGNWITKSNFEMAYEPVVTETFIYTPFEITGLRIIITDSVGNPPAYNSVSGSLLVLE